MHFLWEISAFGLWYEGEALTPISAFAWPAQPLPACVRSQTAEHPLEAWADLKSASAESHLCQLCRYLVSGWWQCHQIWRRADPDFLHWPFVQCSSWVAWGRKDFPNLCRLSICECSSSPPTVLKGLVVLCGTACKDLKQIFLTCQCRDWKHFSCLKYVPSDICIHELLPLILFLSVGKAL